MASGGERELEAPLDDLTCGHQPHHASKGRDAVPSRTPWLLCSLQDPGSANPVPRAVFP